MVSFKVVIGTKDGKSVQKEIQEPEARTLLGKKIGDAINGENLGFTGYEFQITGGSDYCGFPMRKDVEGFARKRILAVEGIGLRKTRKGMRLRKTVCGNTVHPKIAQVNLKVTKAGKESLTAPAEGEKKEEKPAEKKAAPETKEEKKETPKEAPKEEKTEKKEEKAEAKKEAPKEEAKKEAPKEEAKKE